MACPQVPEIARNRAGRGLLLLLKLKKEKTVVEQVQDSSVGRPLSLHKLKPFSKFSNSFFPHGVLWTCYTAFNTSSQRCRLLAFQRVTASEAWQVSYPSVVSAALMAIRGEDLGR